MTIMINGITVTKDDNMIRFTYKDTPVKATVVPTISYDDVVSLVVHECMDIDNSIEKRIRTDEN